jgi:hypothetical protein
MTTKTVQQLAQAITAPKNGVVGLVDEVLATCRELCLSLDWHPGQCRVWDGQIWDKVPEAVMKTSFFRAVLARVATLGIERSPEAVSPYGGEFVFEDGPPPSLRVTFINTPAEQTLSITPFPGFPSAPARIEASETPAAVPAHGR